MVDERGEVNIDNTDVRPPELRWQSGRLLTARSSVRSRVEAHYFFLSIPNNRIQCWRKAGLGPKKPTGGSSAVEQRTVKCASAYAVILWSGVQISPPGCFCVHFFFLCPQNHAGFGAFQTDEALRSHDSSVHSTRVVFIPSKDKIRVRVPMDAHGGLLYMVAYNLRKVENRDRYPDPPYAVAPK